MFIQYILVIKWYSAHGMSVLYLLNFFVGRGGGGANCVCVFFLGGGGWGCGRKLLSTCGVLLQIKLTR